MQLGIMGGQKILKLIVVLSAAIICHASLPEENLSVPELIEYWGYPHETHTTVTKDGYYLTLHRIPRAKGEENDSEGQMKKPVMFLQHGLLCSSSNWVINLPTQSLGFLLADAGFDVWMGNIRGNTYSKNHTKYEVDSKQFWDFSFEEMATYDLPAMIEYTLNQTDQKQLYYVGHSQGTMMIFAGLSENKELQEKIKVVFALAPVASLENIYSPIKYLAYFEKAVKLAFDVLQVREFMPSAESVKFIADKGCPINEKMCDGLLFLLSGYDKKDLNKTRTPVYLTHTPAGTSLKNMLHFSQLVQSGKFQKYDYGWWSNMKTYGSISPPTYDVTKVKNLIVLISGQNDWLADPKDVKWLRKQLPHVIAHHKIKQYNHLDFIWGMSAREFVYKPIIKMAKKFERIEKKKSEKSN